MSMSSNLPPGVTASMIPGNELGPDPLETFANRFDLPKDETQVDYLAQALAFVAVDCDLGEELNDKVAELFGDLYEYLCDQGGD